MASVSQYRFFYGKFLKQICEKIGVKPTRGNMEVIKALIKTKFKVSSLTDLNNQGMAVLMDHAAIFFAIELGIMLDLPGEEGVEEMEMKEFLKLVYGKG